MSDWEEPAVIWLQPWCEGCERHSYKSRQWCPDDVWDECEECGKKSVRYEIAPEKARGAKDKAE